MAGGVGDRKTTNSERLFEAAKKLMPGGVNSPVRAFGSVGGTPRFMERGDGAYLWDVDGNRYIDYVQSWGPLIFGHSHPRVVEALHQAIMRGTSYGAPTRVENELAALVIELVPSLEMIRFVNSGTEATMSALRLARAVTGRDKIIKFAGCYHGHADLLLVQAGSGVATLGLPDSPGVPSGTTANTISLPYNDLAVVREAFAAASNEIACVIVEPIAANMGFVLPEAGYLAGLQAICRENGALFILDEVMTGFRASLHGVQGLWGLDPDLTCLGKVIGGGLPVGAYGGKREIMQMVAPSGSMYQAGTLSGNPLAMTGGLTTLQILMDDGVFEGIVKMAATLTDGLESIAEKFDIPLQVGQVGAMFGFYFLTSADGKIKDYATAKQHADTGRYAAFFHAMLEQGVYFAPSQFEAAFMSGVHRDKDIEQTLGAIERTFRILHEA